jgi:hypothetical protein
MTASDLFTYLDTSAYLAILLGERPAKGLVKALGKRHLCTSVLLLIEAERNLIRLSREQHLTPEGYRTCIERMKEDRERFALKDLTPDLCLVPLFPAVLTPRSSDLVHLRTAAWFKTAGKLEAFLTLDGKQRDAAAELGLPLFDV